MKNDPLAGIGFLSNLDQSVPTGIDLPAFGGIFAGEVFRQESSLKSEYEVQGL
jgi:hypothetical protein